ncbi:MAG UNVERIFIED_CONTAM: hypothetical protein LVR18_21770 [Planctomycetaceae bacterium]
MIRGGLICCLGLAVSVHDEFHPRLVQRVWAENHSGTLTRHLQQSLAAAALRTIRGGNRVRRTT